MLSVVTLMHEIYHHNKNKAKQCHTTGLTEGVHSISQYQQIIYVLRKSKDYVYGIWVYKALGIWKGYYRVKKITGFIHETVNRGKK